MHNVHAVEYCVVRDFFFCSHVSILCLLSSVYLSYFLRDSFVSSHSKHRDEIERNSDKYLRQINFFPSLHSTINVNHTDH